MREMTLSKAKAELQRIINKYVRISYADASGMVHCYTCKSFRHWKEMDAGHFIGGAKNYCRYDLRNIRPQCDVCNRRKHGNGAVFALKLAKELSPKDIEDITTYRDVQYCTYQIQALIQEWRGKLKALAKEKGFTL